MNTTLQAAYHSFKRFSSPIRIFFIIAILFLIAYEVILTQIPAPSTTFYRIGRIGVVVSQILYAFVTGFIFYFIIEHLNTERKRVAVLRLLNNNVQEITRVIETLINNICSTDKSLKKGDRIYYETFTPLCDTINIYDYSTETWFWHSSSYRDYIFKMIPHIKERLDAILSFYDLLDDDWLASLSNLDDALNYMGTLLEVNGRSSTLHLTSLHIWDCYKEANKLRRVSGDFYQSYHTQYKKKFPGGSYMPTDLYYTIE